ncbi:RAMP superfamily CRISPR-associated protein [Gandjariella thermophila]|uniref:CRISPR type III-associated protein domain-containing protein n=1 Tax=Gandjariella thermophila TaxID=1931992 RepID=A0A4D4JBL9_9PSEU|nr:RAMP superfamily CRISPR-associated protein [Gandjariella thermophila]GDY31836.1 hypothetical protein GTS_34690 [Gandjariella thermophila]
MTPPHYVRDDYRLEFRARTPVHVGAAGADAVADLPLAADGQDRLIIPGSSWTGVLRALIREIAPEDEMEVFGYADGQDGQASRLSVFDSVVPDRGVELRTGVGIDRRTGAAATALLYDRLVLPSGQQLVLDLRYEGLNRPSLRKLIAHVRAHGLTIGAASSRGLGLLDCVSATVRRADLRSRRSVLAMLAGRTEPEEIEPAGETTGMEIRLDWRPRQPVVVAASAAGAKGELLPLLTTVDGGFAPVLPGSSIKGVLRSEAERVVRTLLGPDADPTGDPVASVADLATRVPVLAMLFGSPDRAAAIRIADVTARPDEPVAPADGDREFTGVEARTPGWLAKRTRVAVDRWTGGAADARLFTTAEPRVWEWDPIVVRLDPARIPADRLRAAVVLLGVALARIIDGAAGFGHASTRGLGEVEVREVTVTGAAGLPEFAGDWWSWLRALADGTGLDSLLGIEKGVTA